MTLFLDNVVFDNDFFTIDTPDGSLLTLNQVNESLLDLNDDKAEIKVINIEVQKTDGEILKCPCIIGLGNDILEVRTEYKDLEGETLTSDNMKYCVIEIYE